MMATKVKYTQLKVSLTEVEAKQAEKWAKVLQEGLSEYLRNAIIARNKELRRRRG